MKLSCIDNHGHFIPDNIWSRSEAKWYFCPGYAMVTGAFFPLPPCSWHLKGWCLPVMAVYKRCCRWYRWLSAVRTVGCLYPTLSSVNCSVNWWNRLLMRMHVDSLWSRWHSPLLTVDARSLPLVCCCYTTNTSVRLCEADEIYRPMVVVNLMNLVVWWIVFL